MKTHVLAALVALLLSACTAQIHHGLEERDANELVSVLVSRGFRAQKVPEKGKKPTWAIEVDEERAADAMAVLIGLALPRPARATTKSLMQSAALIETPGAERLRQLEAQEGDLEEALETLDGVAGASVELVVPAPPRPGAPVAPSRASVLIRVRPEAEERLNQRRGELRALVAGSVEGLGADDVVLVIDPVSLAPPLVEERRDGLHALVLGLALALTVVAALVVLLGWRLRRARARELLPPPVAAVAQEKSVVVAPQLQRPVVSAGVQRKVA
jgi:type III secretion protein J